MSSTLVYSSGPPVVRPSKASHREMPEVERDSIEYRPMPMPYIRTVRAAEPWAEVHRTRGTRHRLTVRWDLEAACAAALVALGVES